MAEEKSDAVVPAPPQESVSAVAKADPTKDISLLKLITEGKNPRGIPGAKFIVRRLD
jgi:hypothetical protein